MKVYHNILFVLVALVPLIKGEIPEDINNSNNESDTSDPHLVTQIEAPPTVRPVKDDSDKTRTQRLKLAKDLFDKADIMQLNRLSFELLVHCNP